MDVTQEEPLFVVLWLLSVLLSHSVSLLLCLTRQGHCYVVPIHVPEEGETPGGLEGDLRGFCYSKENYLTEHEERDS